MTDETEDWLLDALEAAVGRAETLYSETNVTARWEAAAAGMLLTCGMGRLTVRRVVAWDTLRTAHSPEGHLIAAEIACLTELRSFAR